MVDPRMCLRGDTRLRPVGDAEPSRLQHGKIIGPIADRQRGVALQPELSRNFEQRCELRVPSEDRLFHAFEAAISDDEAVGAIFVEAEHCRDRLGEQGEVADGQAAGTAKDPGLDYSAARQQLYAWAYRPPTSRYTATQSSSE